MYCFSAKYAALKSKSEDGWLGIGIMCPIGATCLPLLPVLFSLFLSDLTEFLSHSYDGLSNVYNAVHIFLDTEEFSVYFRLYLLL